MNTVDKSQLGQKVEYPDHYDAELLFPIDRSPARQSLQVPTPLPFIGHDRWQLFEISWLDQYGKPCVAVASLFIPYDSPYLVESKSLKLYLNSLNNTVFENAESVKQRIISDISQCLKTTVELEFTIPPISPLILTIGDYFNIENTISIIDLDNINTTISNYSNPDRELLLLDSERNQDNKIIQQLYKTDLFKSNCPVTGQPDWATLYIYMEGKQLFPSSLLQYLISFRNHAGFHEQCVEQVFFDLYTLFQPKTLSVEARYTRRGGIDINPWRASPNCPAPVKYREIRQ